MKKLLFFFSALFALLLTGCTEDEINNVIDRVEPTPPVAVENITASFGEGSVSVSTTGNLLAKANGVKSRGITAADLPANPAKNMTMPDAASITVPALSTLVDVSLDSSEFDDGDADMIVPAGKEATTTTSLSLVNNHRIFVYGTLNLTQVSGDDNEYDIIFVMPGGTLNITQETIDRIQIWNYGTMNINTWNFTANQAAVLMTTGDLNVKGKLLTGLKLYVGGNVNCGDFAPYAGSQTYIGGDLNITNDYCQLGTNNSSLYIGGTFKGNKIAINCSAVIECGCKMYFKKLELYNSAQLVTNYLYSENTTFNSGKLYIPSGSTIDLGDANFQCSEFVKVVGSERSSLVFNSLALPWTGSCFGLGLFHDYTKNVDLYIVDPLCDIYFNKVLTNGNEIQYATAEEMLTGKMGTNNESAAGPCYKTSEWDASKPGYGCSHRTKAQGDLPEVKPEGGETEKVDVNYTVNYLEKETNAVLLEATTGKGKDGETVTVTALQVEGYTVDGTSSAQITLDKDKTNSYTFYYTKNAPVKTPVGYSVYYLYRANDHSAASPKVVQAGDGYFVGDEVTEQAVQIDGFEANLSEQTITLQENQTDNVITFYYDAIQSEYILADCLVKFVDRNGVAVAPFYTIQQYVGSWAYADALEIAGYELDGETHKGREMTGESDEIVFVYRQLGEAPIINNNPVNPPSPEIIPDVPFTSDNLNIDIEAGVQGDWIIQADDFAIHNGDILYVSIADTSNKQGHSAYNNFVEVKPSDNVTISLANIDDIYNAYKGKTTTCTDLKSQYYGQAVPYINQINGMLTLEVYLWPAKREGGRIVPIPPTEFLGITDDGVDGKYLVGTELGPRVYANDKYFVQVSAYASYNGGGHGAAMTSYVKVSFHISPRTAN